MKSKKDKQIQQQLGDQAAQNQALFLKAFDRASAPDPIAERQKADTLAFMDQASGKN